MKLGFDVVLDLVREIDAAPTASAR
jgi:hypothetical protein